MAIMVDSLSMSDSTSTPATERWLELQRISVAKVIGFQTARYDSRTKDIEITFQSLCLGNITRQK
jgi:hypothetical protein